MTCLQCRHKLVKLLPLGPLSYRHNVNYIVGTFRLRSSLASIAAGINTAKGNSNDSVWQRQAQNVKNTDVNNPYLELIRETHDPRMHLKTLEDELQGAIGAALGKQGQKLAYKLRLLSQQYQVYEEKLQDLSNNNNGKGGTQSSGNNNNNNNSPTTVEQVIEAAKHYNEYRKEALQARWELQVHRQAAGFLIQNHEYVNKAYPIPEALQIDQIVNVLNGQSANVDASNKSQQSDSNNNANTDGNPKKQFTDQLDWWQRIGRWR